MLFVFNSAYRPHYRENVFNTLNLPDGAINTYQYSIMSNGHEYIHESAMPDMVEIGQEVMIIFIDREKNDAFRFMPLRKGTLIHLWKSEGIIYYDIELREICSAEDVDLFTAQLKSKFGALLFNIDIENIETGYFAFQHDEDISKYILTNDKSWRNTAEQLSKCERFRKIYPVFTRFQLFSATDETRIETIQKGQKWVYDLLIGRQYTAMIDYYMPFADENLDAAMIDLKIGAIPDCLNSSIPSRHLGAKAGRVKYCFSVNDLCKNAEISYESSTIAVAGRNVVFATRPILFSAKKSWTTWALISACVLAIIVFAILKELPADSVLGSGTSQKIPGELASLFANYLTKYKTVFAALFTLANSLFTFFLVLLYNKGRNDK